MGCCKKDSDDIEIQVSDIGCCSSIDDDYSHLKDPWYQHSTKNFWSENPVPIKVIKLHPKAKVPTKSNTGDIAWDICVVEDEKWYTCWRDAAKKRCFELMPGESHTFCTGIKIGVPDNYGFLLRERSGMAVKNDINVGAGVIEGTYRGEWRVHLRNLGIKPKLFTEGDKICQAVLIPIIPALVEEVLELPDTERGEKGFGSSGR